MKVRVGFCVEATLGIFCFVSGDRKEVLGFCVE